eukprot:CCRYP_005297-RA/>CCRYP_005297-RA protein AED:0.49 eAED:1.00 QI:0/0/0/1/0/0/2/0/102
MTSSSQAGGHPPYPYHPVIVYTMGIMNSFDVHFTASAAASTSYISSSAAKIHHQSCFGECNACHGSSSGFCFWLCRKVHIHLILALKCLANCRGQTILQHSN